MVHQELAFCPELSIAENLCMGRYPRRLGMVSRSEMRRRRDELLSQIGVEMDVRQPITALSTAQEQLVQIASAVGTGARILVFDEPTSSLSEPESQRLFTMIDGLKPPRRNNDLRVAPHAGSVSAVRSAERAA